MQNVYCTITIKFTYVTDTNTTTNFNTSFIVTTTTTNTDCATDSFNNITIKSTGIALYVPLVILAKQDNITFLLFKDYVPMILQ